MPDLLGALLPSKYSLLDISFSMHVFRVRQGPAGALPSCTVSLDRGGHLVRGKVVDALASQRCLSGIDCPSDVRDRVVSIGFALQQQLKFQSFRKGQLEVSSAVLRGTDAVLRMPTSGGTGIHTLCCLPRYRH